VIRLLAIASTFVEFAFVSYVLVLSLLIILLLLKHLTDPAHESICIIYKLLMTSSLRYPPAGPSTSYRAPSSDIPRLRAHKNAYTLWRLVSHIPHVH
jgi:hypothetical protein